VADRRRGLIVAAGFRATLPAMEPTELIPVVDGIYRWSVWNEPRRLWFNGHLLRMGDCAILVDPVPVTAAVAEAIDEAGARCARWLCVITNADHRRAAAEARGRFGAEVLVARGDADRFDIAIDDTVDDGDEIAELRAVRVAGAKTPGELALHWPARKLVVLGDAALGKPAGGLSMLPAEKLPDMAAARAGVAKLAELGVEIVLVGDGDDLLSGGAAALASLAPGS
jgi:glyoxylase-like metal-dependent hydrolase (beta-lactamase superfamily II)